MPKKQKINVSVKKNIFGKYRTNVEGIRIGRYYTEDELLNGKLIFHVKGGQDEEAVYKALEGDYVYLQTKEQPLRGLLGVSIGLGGGFSILAATEYFNEQYLAGNMDPIPTFVYGISLMALSFTTLYATLKLLTPAAAAHAKKISYGGGYPDKTLNDNEEAARITEGLLEAMRSGKASYSLKGR